MVLFFLIIITPSQEGKKDELERTVQTFTRKARSAFRAALAQWFSSPLENPGNYSRVRTMEGLFSSPLFTGFGPNHLEPASPPPSLSQIHGHWCRPSARGRELCPRRPGVYGMLDPDGKLIYVGKAKSLRVRLLSYFRPKSRDRKAGRILGSTRSIVWECLPSEFAALLRELELIRRWRPRFNVQGQPHRRTAHLRLPGTTARRPRVSRGPARRQCPGLLWPDSSWRDGSPGGPLPQRRLSSA